ncbi:succinylglutamate desuccinylase/aspartoacylase family protein [Haladaptatus sp. DYF46]|uniref:succinylglutamate desuccinylase/aspartoacylase domain-containing protein n=1 Tax=Haladaptatus sp. DYF46 TaxID=2886041 RepID=UPI001E2DEB09|nr:succinylglutamate desuccinylase/aspartoacylase family protein [Haladaptatus sp. DYF46]
MKEFTNDSSESQTSRRTFLQAGTAAVAATTLGVSATGLGSAQSSDTYKIREGTGDESEVVVIDSGTSGPTAVVVGGMHGNETTGYKAAAKMRDWSIDEGKLVLIPKSNPTALENDTYTTDSGNLNRQFPPGEEPKTPLARAIWGVITDHDADVVFNLHSSKGIYKKDVGPEGVGQAIYPTTIDDAARNATNAAEYMNENHLGDREDYYEFKRGNMIDGDRPLLIHKVNSDLEKPGFIVETTRYGTSLETRIDWELEIVEYLLSQYSIDRTSGTSSDGSGDDSSAASSSDEPSSDGGGSNDDSSGADSSDDDSSSDGSSDDESSSDDSSDGEDSSGSDDGGSNDPAASDRERINQYLEENEDADWATLVRQLLG